MKKKIKNGRGRPIGSKSADPTEYIGLRIPTIIKSSLERMVDDGEYQSISHAVLTAINNSLKNK